MIFQEIQIIVGILIIVPIVLVGSTIAFFILFLRNYIKTKQKMFAYISLLLLASLLLNIFQLGQYFSPTQEDAEFNFIITQILEMMFFYALIIVLEVFNSNEQFTKRQLIMNCLIFTVIGGLITDPDLTTEVHQYIYFVDFHESSFLSIIQGFFYILATIWLIGTLYRSRKTAWSSKQKNLIFWLFIGVSLTVFTALPVIILSFGIKTLIMELFVMLLLLIGEIIQNSGILIIGFAFLKASKEPWLLQRHRIFLLVVYSRDGVQLYSKTFGSVIKSSDTILLAGGFSAISSMITEVVKASGDIKSILLEEKELRIINREHFTSAIIVEFTTQASELAHEKFANIFEKRFSEELKNFLGEITPFNKADEIAAQFFS